MSTTTKCSLLDYLTLRHEIPEDASPDEPLVRSLHWHLHYKGNGKSDALKKKRIRPDALIGAKKHGYDCSVTRLAYSSWEACKAIAHFLDSQDGRKSYVQMLVICVWKARDPKSVGIEVLGKRTDSNPAHACLHYGKDTKEERNRKAAALINAAIREEGAFVLDDPAPQSPDWRGPTEEATCARCRRP